MHGTQERAHEYDELEVLHVLVGLRRKRPVVAHESNAGGQQDHEEKEGNKAQVKGVFEAEVFLLHLGRMHMQPDIEKDQLGLSLVSRQRVSPNDRLPDFAN